ncbi:PilZ domain-containing protein [Geothrix alkalitolerans]|uniref:PilZ domain-containing protein n=1 Tax=Geothrix alkalitolerans TaxID=2922724 RepID=UPI001FAF5E29|nr:PilZ domain-containing protein [Geothrix alkalitolerans]
MGHSTLSAPVLEQFLIQARLTKAVASLRLQGISSRLLGDLRLHSFRPGSTLELSGLHARDARPAEGTAVTLTVLLGEEVLTLDSILLAPLQDEAGDPLLRLDWPHESAQLHRRRDMRVAAPEQAPLKVRVGLGGRTLDALLVNLTETGVGLALDEPLMVDLHAPVEIDAKLPDGSVLHCPGEVRHLAYLEGQDYPTRLGVVLHPGPDMDLEPIHRFIQARRTDRSQGFRQS